MTLLESRHRRSRVAYLSVLRGASSYAQNTRRLREAVVVVSLVLVTPSAHSGLAVGLVLVALVGPVLNSTMALYELGRFRGLPVLRRVADGIHRADGRHQLNLPAELEIVGLAALVAVFSWVAIDLAPPLRLLGLLLGTAYATSVGHGIYCDQTWFNPDETDPPRWHEAMRLLAGPSSAALVALLALPAPWTRAEWTAVLVIVALPVMITVRVWDLDQTIAVVGEVIEEEQQRGRELVLRETEQALAGPLQELESQTAAQLPDSAVLHELAGHARRRLADILSVGGDGDGLPTVDALLGPVLTLARAVGVTVTVQTPTVPLSEPEAETMSWVLQDLVGNAINAGAAAVTVRCESVAGRLSISVTDDAGPMPAGVWQTPGTSSARLADHLAARSGSLDVSERREGKTVTARWLADVREETGSHDQQSEPRPAGRRRTR